MCEWVYRCMCGYRSMGAHVPVPARTVYETPKNRSSAQQSQQDKSDGAHRSVCEVINLRHTCTVWMLQHPKGTHPFRIVDAYVHCKYGH
jgi:hypothetical protein